MKSILRATAILGSSSLVNILVGLASAKVLAVLLGPSGLGFLSLLQALLGLAGLVTGLSIGAGLIRMGANALAREDHAQVAAMARAVWLLFWVLSGLAVLILAAFRVPISHWMLGGSEHADSVLLVGLALPLNLASGLQTSLLNAYHRVATLARISIVNSVLGTGATLILVWLWHEQGIILAIIVGSIIGLAISSYYLRREVLQEPARPSRKEVALAAWSLLRFGAPYTASLLVGTGVQLALPVLVLHTLSTESVGFYRAASSISGVYLGFLLIAMGQDYYPRVSAASDKSSELAYLVNQQHRLVMLLAGPIVLGTLALAPYLVPIIYSPAFSPTVEILEWQLIGDLLKFSSWTMGFVILARSRTVMLFLVELLAGANTLATSWLGVHWFGLAGLGIGFLATYAVHYVVTWLIVRREIGLTWARDNKLMLLSALLAATLVRGLPAVGLGDLRTPVALSFSLLAGIGSLYVIWRELGGTESMQLAIASASRQWRQRRADGEPDKRHHPLP